MTDPTDRDRIISALGEKMYRLGYILDDDIEEVAKLLREARAEGRRAAFEEAARLLETVTHPAELVGYARHYAVEIRALAAKEQP